MNTPNPPMHANGNSVRLDAVNLKWVLVPVDFSVCTLETLRYAKAFAEKLDAVVDVLLAIQLTVARNEVALPRTGLIRTMSEGAPLELKRLVGILCENEVEATVSVREGRAHEVILCEARSNNAALFIMVARDRSWLSGVLRRHAVMRVIHDSPCPVVVLRAGMTAGANLSSRNGSSLKTEFHFG